MKKDMDFATFFSKVVKQLTNPDVKIGDKMLRQNGSDRKPDWVVFTVNETYLRLIKDYPINYRYSDGSTIRFKLS